MTKSELIEKFTTRLDDHAQKYGRDYSALKKYLLDAGFYDQPAAKGHHNNFPGGLAKHVINFHYALQTMLGALDPEKFPLVKGKSDNVFDPLIVAIGHDITKCYSYKIGERNTKIDGQWRAIKQYEYDSSNSVYDHKVESMMLMRHLVPGLSKSEELAIYYAEGVYSLAKMDQEMMKAYDNAIKTDVRIYFTHTADMLASQFMEKTFTDVEVDRAIRSWKYS